MPQLVKKYFHMKFQMNKLLKSPIILKLIFPYNWRYSERINRGFELYKILEATFVYLDNFHKTREIAEKKSIV